MPNVHKMGSKANVAHPNALTESDSGGQTPWVSLMGARVRPTMRALANWSPSQEECTSMRSLPLSSCWRVPWHAQFKPNRAWAHWPLRPTKSDRQTANQPCEADARMTRPGRSLQMPNLRHSRIILHATRLRFPPIACNPLQPPAQHLLDRRPSSGTSIHAKINWGTTAQSWGLLGQNGHMLHTSYPMRRIGVIIASLQNGRRPRLKSLGGP